MSDRSTIKPMKIDLPVARYDLAAVRPAHACHIPQPSTTTPYRRDPPSPPMTSRPDRRPDGPCGNRIPMSRNG